MLQKPSSAKYEAASAVIHSENNKICSNSTNYKSNKAVTSITNGDCAKKPDGNPDDLNYASSDTTSGLTSNPQYYNGTSASEGLRLRTGANKHEKGPKGGKTSSLQQTIEMLPPHIDGDNSAVSDLERTRSLKGITVFRGRVPGESFASSQPYGSEVDCSNSKMNSNLKHSTPTPAVPCATAGHRIHYTDEHVESYL